MIRKEIGAQLMYISRISTKQLQLAGVGIIRSDLIKKTLRGKIYEATLYYNDITVDVRILYKRNGKGTLLGVVSEDGRDAFREIMKGVLPILPTPDIKNLMAIRLGTIIALIITYLNLRTPTTTIFGMAMNTLDIAGIIVLIILHRIERDRYVKRDRK